MSQAAPYRKPDLFTLKVMQPLLAALGVAPTLTVRGRTSGRPYRFPVLPLDYQGESYVVAPRGNTQWARNLRATGEAELKVSGRSRRVKATEIPAGERKPLVDAYVQQHGNRYGGFVAKEFEAMPNPADHPVFLLQDL
jgi:deazaflavin-dependent oxidoreductase (nitroreductase family)